MKGYSIVFENEDFIAVDKHSGVLTIPDRHNENQLSLLKSLNHQFGKVFVVHRLDKDTSGLLLFAKTEATHKHLSLLFEHRKIGKHYLGIVKGSFAEKSGSINEPLAENPHQKGKMIVSKRGKPSLTDYLVMEDYGLYSLVHFTIHSGRTHQIRVHAKFAGHPIVSDPMYGDGQPVLLSSFKKKYKLSLKEEQEKPLLDRLALHSFRLVFTDLHGMEHTIEAPVPKDMRALMNQLKKNR